MRKTVLGGIVVAIVLSVLGSYLVWAQAPQGAGRGQQVPPQPMSFFVTSVGMGNGANLGGLAGADTYCQKLGVAAGRGDVTWHAYLSTQGPGAVNARDRIGSGPWYNKNGARVAQNVGDLHGDTLDQARVGNSITRVTAISEKGEQVNGVGSQPNMHDILTGSRPDGTAFTDGMDHTCNNWTSNSTGTAQVGHHDRAGGGNISWNSTHPSKGCSQENLVATGGAGLVYCFAIN